MKCRVMIVLMSVILAFGAAVLAKDTVIESKWTPAPVLIDGKDLEWTQDTLLLDNGSKAEYFIKNDAQNLYIFFIFKSPMSSTTIDFTGMRIFFNTEGKKSKDLGVRFFKRQAKPEEIIAAMEKRGETLTEEQKAEILKRKAIPVFENEVINPKKVSSPTDPAVPNEPPMFRVAFKERASVYEFRIPLSRINQPGGVGTEPGKTLKLGFEWGGMVKEAMQSIGASRSEASTRATGGAVDTATMLRGGQEGGEDMGGGGMDVYRDPRFKKHSFWIDVKLASK